MFYINECISWTIKWVILKMHGTNLKKIKLYVCNCITLISHFWRKSLYHYMITYIYTVLYIYVQTWVVVAVVVGMFHRSSGLLLAYHIGGLSLITLGSLQGLWQTKWPCVTIFFKHFSFPLSVIISSPLNTIQHRGRCICEWSSQLHALQFPSPTFCSLS
jgi:hypothetical protein